MMKFQKELKMTKIKGVFLSDLHMPENINLKPIIDYISDLKPDLIILGGDIIDAKGLHGLDSRPLSSFDSSWYDRDCILLSKLLVDLHMASPKAKFVYLEGNHEERYTRLMVKYPKVLKGRFNFIRDCTNASMNIKWIPYATYESFYRLGDTVFMHGKDYPDLHAKKYAIDNAGLKCIYGHLHHYQSYTTRTSIAVKRPHYAVTVGCLSTTKPEWKKGAPNQWVNGFVSFVYDGKTVLPQVHLIEKGKFYVGGKEYK